MEEITGVKLISSATVFGSAAVIFTTVPFMLVILRGIMRSKDRSTGGSNFLSIVLLAFLIHSVCTICFIGTMYVLDYLDPTTKDTRYYTEKLFNIFWAEGESNVFSKAEVTSSSLGSEAKGAYLTLLTVRTLANLFYTVLPLVVILGAMAYGVGLATKDTYRQDYLTVVIYAGISMVSAMLLYVAWAYIASYALFLPSGTDNLFKMISDNWVEMVKVK